MALKYCGLQSPQLLELYVYVTSKPITSPPSLPETHQQPDSQCIFKKNEEASMFALTRADSAHTGMVHGAGDMPGPDTVGC